MTFDPLMGTLVHHHDITELLVWSGWSGIQIHLIPSFMFLVLDFLSQMDMTTSGEGEH